jgi:hypothetical protein
LLSLTLTKIPKALESVHLLIEDLSFPSIVTLSHKDVGANRRKGILDDVWLLKYFKLMKIIQGFKNHNTTDKL